MSGEVRLDVLASLASGLVALAESLSNDHPLATGALVGLGGGLTLAWLVWRRHQREAQPKGGDTDVQKLLARGELKQIGRASCRERVLGCV